MPRAINGTVKRKRKKRLDKLTRGYVGGRKNHRMQMELRKRSLNFAFRDRKVRKREFRALWITRISAAARENGISYSRFMEGLKKLGVDINRKMLSEMAINAPEDFAALVKQAAEQTSPAGKSA
jgi:large subunit ribosomal protein L20